MVWFVVSAVAVETKGGEPWTYVVGFLTLQLGATLALGLLVRFVFVKVASTPRQLWSPWLLVIAVWFSLPQAAIRLQASLDRAAPARSSLLAPAPPGHSYRPLPPAEERQLVDSFRNENVRPREQILREVTYERAPLGVIIAFAFDQPQPLSEVARGFREAGGKTRPSNVDGEKAVIGTAPDAATAAFGARRNSLYLALAPDRPSAERILSLATTE